MNNYTGKYKKIIKELIRKSFPGLRKVYVFEVNLGNYYSAIVLYFIFFKLIFIGKKLRKKPKKAVKGILAHELCHFEIFSKMNIFQLRDYFINYVVLRNQKFMKKFEHETDLLTIKKGYGEELYQAALNREKKLRTEKTKKIIIRYMSSKETKQVMKKLK